MRANEGDAYVLGALPAGTIVHCIEKDPGKCFNWPYNDFNAAIII